MRFIKLHIEILNWEWYTDANVLRIFIHLLLKANYGFSKWKGYNLQPGQLITGRKKLASELELTEKQVRISLSKLEKSGTISIERANRFSIVTICNWALYQSQTKGKGPAKRPTEGQQRATVIEEYKKNTDNKFDQFWELYDKKTGKKRCLVLWNKLSDADKTKILTHVPKYVKSKPDKQFRKDPATYLNGEHWLDDVVFNEHVKLQSPEPAGFKF
ncbi:hypothetical protein SLH46_09370 [Draconibacterium sp. IB214405]|uniref:hypothetical protein n=1 Tax=Draconibacterium sp. IB214405 TaxID=3097352 RepID=UPI002A13985F|nr:hypothetical protein [Draconibacterium sp. IB214405]MDX8339390.1 hypothetical protein [Draconibacterium sp. IB214405]